MSNLGEGIENEARENGFVAGRLEDIHAMFNAGISTKDIAKCFKMPWNKVEKIVEDNIILTEDDFKEELSCEDRVKILKDEFQIDLDEESLDTFQ